MRSIIGALFLTTLAVGCEHTNSKKSDPPPPTRTGDGDPAPAKTVDTPAERPAVAPAPPPPAQQMAEDGKPRPPVPADLATYVANIKGDGKLVATFDTSMGAIHCELFGEQAPMTVANFVGLATGQKPWLNPKTGEVTKAPYFDGLTFHRVIKEFMIQGGDPMGSGTGGPGYKFEDEFAQGLKMQPGTLAMANAGRATNGSQFFITEVATDFLQNKHTIFGQCKELDIVKQIARVPQDPSNKPDSPITMKVTVSKMKSW